MPINEAKWIPLTVLKLSGTAGNYLVKAQSSPFGQLLFSQTLVKQISNGLYKVSPHAWFGRDSCKWAGTGYVLSFSNRRENDSACHQA